MTKDALDQLTVRARALGSDVSFGLPAPSVPDTILGAPIDPGLRDLLRHHDSVQIRGGAFSLFVYGVAGPETIEWSSCGRRVRVLDWRGARLAESEGPTVTLTYSVK